MKRRGLLPIFFLITIFIFCGCKEKKLIDLDASDDDDQAEVDSRSDATESAADAEEEDDGDRNLLLELLENQLESTGAEIDLATNMDVDHDGRPNMQDNCPEVHNKDQKDTDNDGWGDRCDADDDEDGIPDVSDNCPLAANPSQSNSDGGDNIGDACDNDGDNDDRPDASDNCPDVPNNNQADIDEDGEGDACDDDRDGDLVANAEDNCEYVENPDQEDTDADDIGNACVDDADGDGISNEEDNCPFIASEDETDTDADGEGDICDENDDNDTFLDGSDNCPLVANDDQLDSDEDEEGDACDADNDNDGVPNDTDVCPLLADAKNDSRRCDAILDGVIDTIMNAPVNSIHYFSDYAAEPAGFFTLQYPMSVYVLEHPGDTESYTNLYVGMRYHVMRVPLENGEAVLDRTTIYKKTDWNFIHVITRLPGNDGKMIFLTEYQHKEADGKYYYDLSLRTMDIDLDDYGILHSEKKIDLGRELKDLPARAQQYSMGAKETPSGYALYITRYYPVGTDENGKEKKEDIEKNKVFMVSLDPDLNLTGVSEFAPGSGIEMTYPRSTLVHDGILYVGTNRTLMKFELNEDGTAAKNPDDSLKYEAMDSYPPTYYLNALLAIKNYVFISGSSGDGISVMRGDAFSAVTTGRGYNNCSGNCGSPANVGFYSPMGMSSLPLGANKHRFFIADYNNLAIRSLDITIADGVTVDASETIMGQHAFARNPVEGELTNFYGPFGIRNMQVPGSGSSCAYITTMGGSYHMVWLAKILGDKVVSIEQLTNSSKTRNLRHMAAVDTDDEWRLYIASNYRLSEWPRIYLLRASKETCQLKGDPENVWYGDGSLYSKPSRIAASPDGKYLFVTGTKSDASGFLVRLSIGENGTIVSNSTKDLTALGPWDMPISVASYHDDSAEKNILIVGEKHIVRTDSGDKTEYSIYKATLDENGDITGAPERIVGAGPNEMPTVQPSFSEMDPLKLDLYLLEEMIVMDDKLIFSDLYSRPRIYEYDLKTKKLKLLAMAKHLTLIDGEMDEFGTHYGFYGFDVWKQGDMKGLILGDYYKNAIRLLR